VVLIDVLAYVEEVIVTVFEYLKMLHETDAQAWIFKECRKLSEMAFQFKEKSPASSYTSTRLDCDLTRRQAVRHQICKNIPPNSSCLAPTQWTIFAPN
jgi:secreted Zn-dependent insulinase-like peptidase